MNMLVGSFANVKSLTLSLYVLELFYSKQIGYLFDCYYQCQNIPWTFKKYLFEAVLTNMTFMVRRVFAGIGEIVEKPTLVFLDRHSD